jgi:hypothetical protein
LGRLAASNVSAVLATCRFGAVELANRAVLGKSGTFAAYAAHGVVPVVFGSKGATGDGLVEGSNVLLAGETGGVDPAQAALRIIQWYRDHRIERHASAIAGMVRQSVRAAA